MTITHSSSSNEWATPWDLFREIDAEFRFGLDVAAAPWNAKCGRYLTREDNALNVDWSSRCPDDHAIWCNPPYGRDAGKFVAKAYHTAFPRGASLPCAVVCLVFSRTDTAWWSRFAMRASEIRFIRGRVHFTRDDGKTGPATAASCLLIFDPRQRGLKPVSKRFHPGQKHGPAVRCFRPRGDSRQVGLALEQPEPSP